MSNAAPGDIIDVVSDGVDRVSDFIAGPTPANPLGAAVQESYRFSCDFYSAAPDALTLSTPGFSTLGLACQQYLADNNYDMPVEGGDTEFTFEAEAYSGVGCNTVTVVPTRVWPGIHRNVRFNRFLSASTTGCQSGLIKGPEWIDDDGNTFAPNNPGGTNYASDPVVISQQTINQQITPGANPAPNPGSAFAPVEAPGGGTLPLFPLPETYDDPVTGPNTPFPELGPADSVFAPVPTPDTSPLPDSGDDSADIVATGSLVEAPVIGAVVTVTQMPAGRTGTYGQPGGPDWNTRLGNLYFGMKVGCDLAWSQPIEINLRRMFVPTPGVLPAVSAVFAGENGASGIVTLVRQPIPEDEGENASSCVA